MTDLASVIAQVESADNPKRLRFESGLHEAWVMAPTPARDALMLDIAKVNDCSLASARMIACTSWGRYQILGENLYGPCHVATDVFSYIASPASELAAFVNFCNWRKVYFSLDDIVATEAHRNAFITAYNGPNNVAGYWQKMRDAITLLAA